VITLAIGLAIGLVAGGVLMGLMACADLADEKALWTEAFRKGGEVNRNLTDDNADLLKQNHILQVRVNELLIQLGMPVILEGFANPTLEDLPRDIWEEIMRGDHG